MRRLRGACLFLTALTSCSSPPPPNVTAAPAPPAAPPKPSPPPRPRFTRSDGPLFDVHTHIEPGALPRAVELLGRQGIVEMVNLSGGSPGGDGLEEILEEARRVGHTVVFVNPDFREIKKGPGYGARMA